MTITKSDIEVFVSDLKAKYKLIRDDKNDDRFYTKISQYGKYLLDNKLHPGLYQELYKAAKKDMIPYKKAARRYVNQWKVLAPDLLLQAEKAGFKDDPKDPFSSQIGELTNKLKEPNLNFYDKELQSFNTPYRFLVEKFRKEGKINMISKKHLDPELMPRLHHYHLRADNEWDKFKRHRGVSTWWAHYNIMRLTHGVYELDDKGEYFSQDDIVSGLYRHEFRKIASGQGSTLVILKRDKFDDWIYDFHKYTLSRLTRSHQLIRIASHNVSNEVSVKEIKETRDPYKAADFSDTATRKGVEKRWDILQTMWTVYESSSRADAITVAIKSLPFKGRDVKVYDGVFEGFKRERLFGTWDRKERHYLIGEINHDRLEEHYEKTKNLYRKFADEYQKRNRRQLTSTLRAKNITFSENDSAIIVDGDACNLPPLKNEHDLCVVMFKHKVSKPVDWSVVYEKMTGDENFEGKWRRVYDTMRRTNKRVMKCFNVEDELFGWQSLTIKRNF